MCERSSTSMMPDLMGKTAPPGGISTPLFTYSSDLGGAYDGGLAMKRQGTTCRTSYQIADTFSTTNPSEYSVHAWATNQFSSLFNLDGVVTFSFYTETVGGSSGRGYICATLLDRSVSSGVVTDTTIGSGTFDFGSWPTTARHLSYSFKVTNYDIPASHRLVLVLNVRSESANDLVFLYDHPLYPTLLEVATSTPL
jgi:hypothetical protein